MLELNVAMSLIRTRISKTGVTGEAAEREIGERRRWPRKEELEDIERDVNEL